MPEMEDPFDLDRFVSAQQNSYVPALGEIRSGAKRTHWMWFIFPQIAGLGSSATSHHYAITGMEEAEAYLAHPVLGPRLREIVSALQKLPEPNAQRVFGSIDAAKLRSSLTLFAHTDEGGIFEEALQRWFGGDKDPATLQRL